MPLRAVLTKAKVQEAANVPLGLTEAERGVDRLPYFMNMKSSETPGHLLNCSAVYKSHRMLRRTGQCRGNTGSSRLT